MTVGEIGIFPVVHYKHAANSTKAVTARQHQMTLLLWLQRLTRKRGDAFGDFESVFPVICPVVSLNTRTEGY